MTAAVLDRAKQIYAPPPSGSPYSVALPNSELPGRSAVYRHWRFKDGLLKSLDPNVCEPSMLDRRGDNRAAGTILTVGVRMTGNLGPSTV